MFYAATRRSDRHSGLSRFLGQRVEHGVHGGGLVCSATQRGERSENLAVREDRRFQIDVVGPSVEFALNTLQRGLQSALRRRFLSVFVGEGRGNGFDGENLLVDGQNVEFVLRERQRRRLRREPYRKNSSIGRE